jgi:hypothetical protein
MGWRGRLGAAVFRWRAALVISDRLRGGSYGKRWRREGPLLALSEWKEGGTGKACDDGGDALLKGTRRGRCRGGGVQVARAPRGTGRQEEQ